jgi:hypothetical protein
LGTYFGYALCVVFWVLNFGTHFGTHLWYYFGVVPILGTNFGYAFSVCSLGTHFGY